MSEGMDPLDAAARALHEQQMIESEEGLYLSWDDQDEEDKEKDRRCAQAVILAAGGRCDAALFGVLTDIAEMTDMDDPDSYLNDDPHRCLEVISEKVRKSLAHVKAVEDE